MSLARKSIADAHHYWSAEADVRHRSWDQQAGLFKGCYTMMGEPLAEDSKRASQAYLNTPALERDAKSLPQGEART